MRKEGTRRGGRREDRVRFWIACLGMLVGVLGLTQDASAAQLGETTITLQSVKYYASHDYTRLVYQVTSSRDAIPDAWVLGVGDCVVDDVLVSGASSEFTWVSLPFRGMRFTPTLRNEKFYLYLEGHWSVEETDVAAEWLASSVVLTGLIDGPACGEASLSLEVVEGASIAFPTVAGDGTYPASSGTVLRVTSSTSGWALSHALELATPPGGSEAIVARIFEVTYEDYAATSGTTEVEVSYALVVSIDDFAGLPEGTYVIHITYMVSTD